MGSLQQPLQPGTVLRFGSLEFMSLDGCYDMILFPPPGDSDNGGRQPAHRRRNRRRLPRAMEEQHSSSPRPLPRRRRGRRGNQGQAGGSASSAVERVDSTSTPTGGAPGVDLALEAKTSAVSPQHTDSGQTDDTSALAKSLLDVTLVPETTVQSVPDVTSSPPVDQEAGGHDPQLEQIRGVQARLDEGAGALEPIRRDVGQAWAGQPRAGEIRHLP
jgi:hypothetical protein